MSTYLSVCLSVDIFRFFHLSVCLSVCLSVYLLAYLSQFLSVCLSVCCLSVCLLILKKVLRPGFSPHYHTLVWFTSWHWHDFLSFCLSAWLSVCLSAHSQKSPKARVFSSLTHVSVVHVMTLMFPSPHDFSPFQSVNLSECLSVVIFWFATGLSHRPVCRYISFCLSVNLSICLSVC